MIYWERYHSMCFDRGKSLQSNYCTLGVTWPLDFEDIKMLINEHFKINVYTTNTVKNLMTKLGVVAQAFNPST